MIYVVTMYRWGNRENHSYLLCICDAENKAVKRAKKEEHYRGGKYKAEIIKLQINADMESAEWIKEL